MPMPKTGRAEARIHSPDGSIPAASQCAVQETAVISAAAVAARVTAPGAGRTTIEVTLDIMD
jgi:hypothetical protein